MRLNSISIQSKTSSTAFSVSLAAVFEEDFDLELFDEDVDFKEDEEPKLPEPLEKAVPDIKALPRPSILPFFNNASVWISLNTIACAGILANSVPLSPTVYQCPVLPIRR